MDNIDFQITNILKRVAIKPSNDNQVTRRPDNCSEQARAQSCISIVGNNNVVVSSGMFWLLCLTFACYIILFVSR